VNLLDRYLSLISIDGKQEMNLVACAALLIATKYEEIYPPTGRELLHSLCKGKSTENSYSHDDLLQLESHMLSKLEFQI